MMSVFCKPLNISPPPAHVVWCAPVVVPVCWSCTCTYHTYMMRYGHDHLTVKVCAEHFFPCYVSLDPAKVDVFFTFSLTHLTLHVCLSHFVKGQEGNDSFRWPLPKLSFQGGSG
jgi:hypothetical protein